MTTPRIEEMVEELWNKMCEETCIACNGTGIHYDKIACSLCEGHGFETPKKYLTQALTQAHQAGKIQALHLLEDLYAKAEDKAELIEKFNEALQDNK